MNGNNEMEVFQLALAVSLAVAGVVGAIIAAWRMIPFRGSPEGPTARLDALEEAVDGIRMSVIELADKYEITIRRNNVRVGRLRRKVARLQGDDVDEDEEVEPALTAAEGPPAAVNAPPLTKAQMFAHWHATHPNGGGS